MFACHAKHIVIAEACDPNQFYLHALIILQEVGYQQVVSDVWISPLTFLFVIAATVDICVLADYIPFQLHLFL